jgi:aspartate kinase
MSLIVMKFGGSSVADAEKIKRVAGRVMDRRKQGHGVVVVVSAPGDMTDDLIALADGVTNDPDDREMDMLLATGEQVSIALLSMAIKDRGMDAVSMTGPQAGIYADSVHTRARITHIKPVKLLQELKKGRIVIVAGFQGLNAGNDIVTLGRGGSDLTAVALAAALKADACEIFTDVRGVYTTDPRIVPEAQKIETIHYDEMLELAGAGAQVMQARSIEVGKKFGVPIHVRSTFSEEEGTLITGEVPNMEDVVVSGVAYDKNQTKVTFQDVADEPGVAARLFGALADDGVNVDMIIQSSGADGKNDISFTISRTDVKKAQPILDRMKSDLRATNVTLEADVAKVSIVGVGMRSHSGVASRMFATLARESINIQMISTSEIAVSCVIGEKYAELAVRALHDTFEVGRSPAHGHR